MNAFVSDETRLFTASSDSTIKVLPCSQELKLSTSLIDLLSVGVTYYSRVDSLGLWCKSVDFAERLNLISPNQ